LSEVLCHETKVQEKNLKMLSETNLINVSVKKTPNFYVFLGKKYLESNEEIELHALGNAVSISVIAAENLVR